MKYALVLRKLIYNGASYYQVIDKVIGEENFNDTIHVVEGDKFLNQDLNPCGTGENTNIVYLEIDKDTYQNANITKTDFFKMVDNELTTIPSILEQNNVMYEFFYRYRDFTLVPDYDSFELVNDLKKDLFKKIIGQERAISKILSKIYNNQMFFETDLDLIDMQKNKSNILVMGPFGTGKSTIKKIIKNNLSPIPIIEYNLTGNYEKDIFTISQKLILASYGNIYLASRGIVIFDGISSFSSTFIETENGSLNYYLDTLERIMKTGIVQYTDQYGNTVTFDYSLVTNICMIDINYDCEERETDLFTRVDSEKILELGMTSDFLHELFDSEIIFMEEMTPELAEQILKDKKVSPLYQIKDTLEKKGKIVKIGRDFVSKLIDYGLEYDEGFAGINKALKYVLQDKDLSLKTITFKGEDFDYLQIGTVIIDDDIDSTVIPSKETKIVIDNLEIDSKNKKINNLTKKDVIDLIKKNIKGQDEQIFGIVNSFFEHVLTKTKDFSASEYRKLKDNILIIGGTGVGKTAIVENLVEIFNIPFIRVDATSYSGTGIVGKDVESMLKDLVKICNGDVKKAENGVIFIDELDKIASSFSNVDIGKDVQNALLTLVEGNKITISPGNDFRENFHPYTIDTSNILFIGAGAYEGLEEITKKRVRKEKTGSTMGFKDISENKEINENPTTDDLGNYGMVTQLISRMPDVYRLNVLNEDVLFDIVNTSENGYVNLKVRSYAYDGIKIEMSEGFKRRLASLAFQDKKGARSIKTIFKRVLTEIDKNNLDGEVETVILNDESLDDYKSIQYVKRKNR